MGAPMLMLAMGVGQGVMSYQQSREAQKAAEANAEQARQMQAYEAEIKKTNVALLQGQERRAVKQQEYANRARLGRVQAAMGATGVSVTGTFMDVLAEQVILGENKNSMLRSQSLRQQTGAINAGNMAIYKQELAEYQYINQAKQAKQAAITGLAMGVLGGVAGYSQAGGGWSSLFGSNTLMTSDLGSQWSWDSMTSSWDTLQLSPEMSGIIDFGNPWMSGMFDEPF